MMRTRQDGYSAAVLRIVFILLMSSAAPAVAQPDPEVDRAIVAARARAAGGDATAQFSLGALLYYGATDLAQAIDWVAKAAAQGHPDAEFHVGQMYDFGFGVSQDAEQALTWYRKAAARGNAAGQRAVADFYRHGRAVPLNAAEAARWYRLAADGDDLRAQYELGQLYLDGTGVVRNYGDAYLWFSLAASQTPLPDNRKAIVELRNIAAARMTPAEVTAAEARVAAWKPRGRR